MLPGVGIKFKQNLLVYWALAGLPTESALYSVLGLYYVDIRHCSISDVKLLYGPLFHV